jgi:type I restriction enzyme S subunit
MGFGSDIKKLVIDKSSWSKVKFGDVAFEPKESVKDAVSEGVEHVVGLEHIDPEDIHLRRSAGIEESTTFTKSFSSGDVLFGRRRAYLKKAARAEFSGICSGDITVMRAKENLLPELLPFIVNNEKFFDWAVTHSAGGLSPRCKFKDLANYEFLFPPKDQQAEIAEMLWAMDEMIEGEKKFLKSLLTFNKSFLFDSVSSNDSEDKKLKEHKLGDLGETYGGLDGKTKKDFGHGRPFITYMNVFKNTKVDLNGVDLVKINEGENQNQVRYGDILITGSSETPDEVGMTSVILDEISGVYLNSFCFGFRLNSFTTLIPEYARFLMRGREVRNFMYKHAQGSTRFNISKSTIKDKLILSIPSLDYQKKISKILDKNESRIVLIENKITNSKKLQKSFINQVF